jgi:hypothetical protein
METGHGAFLKACFQGREETTVLSSIRPRRLARREAAGHLETIWSHQAGRLPDVLHTKSTLPCDRSLFNPIHTALIDRLRGQVAEAPARNGNVNGLMGKREKYRSVTKRAKRSDLNRQWGSRDSVHRLLGRSLAEFTMNASSDETRTGDLCRDSKVVWRTFNDMEEHGRHRKSWK